KYDGAFYSRASLNIDGGEEGTGVLNIEAENEGLNSEMHLTINGGNINITSQDDGINANEDGVSVITINGGGIIVSGGLGAEGDGIDSNGKIVINGGKLWAFGNGRTGDGGIDADMGITVNGGSVAAFGSRNDSVTALGELPVFSFILLLSEAEEAMLNLLTKTESACPRKAEEIFSPSLLSEAILKRTKFTDFM
ncbi:MAG: carbohydrate-binding domain-containing protein, partial [Oscillospiraceae bacterium]|nr:carbohydrate-binding domain-containing protein [Oscillospiraceae bacterium]